MPRVVNNPLDLTGCVLWLDATDGNSVITDSTGAVSQWSDKSGQGNHVTQATGNKQPIYTANLLGGYPAVVFDGSNDFLAKTGLALAKPATVYIVAKWNTSFATQSSIVDGGNANHLRFFRDATSQVNIYAGTFLTAAGVNETAWQTWCLTFNGPSSNIRQSGTRVGPLADVGTTNTDGFTVGAIGSGSGDWANCSIAEVVVFSRALTEGERIDVERYLANKWGFTFNARVVRKPTDLAGCVLWLDANDAAQVIVDANNKVSQWSDKSGQANHLVQAAGSKQPLYLPTDNAGKPAIKFDGVDDFLSKTNTTLFTTAGYTVFLVVRPDSTATSALFDNGKGGTIGAGLWIISNNRAIRHFGVADASDGAGQTSAYELWSVAFANGTGATLKVNSAKQPLSGNLTTVLAPDGASFVTLGSRLTGIDFWSAARFCEAIVFNRPLTDGEVTAVERYLATKWMLVASPRTVKSPLDLAGCVAWYDANDPTTVALDASGNVSQWSDKSSQGNHVSQGTPANRPSFNPSDSTFSGKSSIQGNGTSQYLTRANTLLATPANGYTFIYVVSWVSLPSANYQFVVDNFDAVSGQGAESGVSPTNLRAVNHSGIGTGVDGGPVIGTPEILTQAWTPLSPATISVNSALQALSPPGSSTLGVPAATASISILARGNNSLWAAAKVAEVIIYNRPLSDGERRQVERYLAIKWGIA